ncbi:MAG: histidinol-phosphate transaminase, partial [Thermodesulfovibrionales bacterium]
MMQRLVKSNVRSLAPYKVTDVQCRIKLDANESPYGFSRALNALGALKTNRYPDPEARELRRILGRVWGVGEDSILQGNGSDELIFYLVATFGGPVLFPVPTFSMYAIIATVFGERTVEVPLKEDFRLDGSVMLREVRRCRPRLIFLSSPNNPTGNNFSLRVLEAVIRESRGIVVIDEAYQPFSPRDSMIPMITRYPNLVVMRTLSKIGLAALRTGFIVGRPEVIAEVNKVRLPFNVNALSQAVAARVLKHPEAITRVVSAVVRERDRLSSGMRKIKGIRVFPSDANFVLFRVREARRGAPA